jgi:hypothetical protein
LFTTSFIKHVEKATWLSPIVVVPKKNGKLKICVNFKTLNVATKKEPYLLPFTDEVINTIARHEVYTFLNGFSRYIKFPSHQKISTKLPLLLIRGLLYGL